MQVTEQDLDDFEAKYRGSEEEKADVLKYYDQFSGDMDKVCWFLSEAMDAGSFWKRRVAWASLDWLAITNLPFLIVDSLRSPHLHPRQVFAWVMCSDPGHDAHRFADIIADGLRASGEAPSKKFAAWEKKVRRRKAPDLATSVAKGGGSKKEKTKGNTSDLVALIR